MDGVVKHGWGCERLVGCETRMGLCVEQVRLDVQSQTYLEAQRKLKLIETQYANVLF